MPRRKWTGGKIKIDPPITLQKLVDDYLTVKRHFKHTSKECTFKEAHEHYLESLQGHADFICGESGNTLGVLFYRVNPHQQYFRCRSRQPLIEPLAEKLKEIDGCAFASFEDLYAEIKRLNLHGFGPTTVYDYALRWGWHASPRIHPRDFVYLHATPGKSAKALFQKGYLPLVEDIDAAVDKNHRLPLEVFPDEIRNSEMNAADVEHFLCCYDKLIFQLPERNNQ